MSDSSTFTLHPTGRFDFNSYNEFRQSYESALAIEGLQTLIVDLSDVQYIDSAALGILLLLRDKASESSTHVVLSNAQGTVKDVLQIANFHRIFSVS